MFIPQNHPKSQQRVRTCAVKEKPVFRASLALSVLEIELYQISLPYDRGRSGYEIRIIYELRIGNQVKLWSSQLWEQFLQLRREAWKIQDFNGVWTRDLAIPVRRSNQLSYEATDVGSWSYTISSLIHSSRDH